jgi:hypothetical protein
MASGRVGPDRSTRGAGGATGGAGGWAGGGEHLPVRHVVTHAVAWGRQQQHPSRSVFMDCQDFIARYSDYVDGLAAASDLQRLRAHHETCERCGRYHRVMQQGLELARAIPPIEPSSDFRDRLQHRLLHVRDELGDDGRQVTGGTAVSLALAGLLAFAAWGPLMRDDAGTEAASSAATPAAVASAIAREVVSSPARGAADEAWWAGVLGASFGAAFHGAPASLAGTFPGPHSPLVVTTPPVDSIDALVRAVFAVQSTVE